MNIATPSHITMPRISVLAYELRTKMCTLIFGVAMASLPSIYAGPAAGLSISTTTVDDGVSVSTLFPEQDLEQSAAGIVSGDAEAGSNSGITAVIAVAGVVAMLAVVVVIAKRSIWKSTSNTKVSVLSEPVNLDWDASTSSSIGDHTYHMDQRVNQFLEATHNIAQDVSSFSESTEQSLPPSSHSRNKSCHLGDIDHLRPWHDESSSSLSKELTMTVFENEHVICDLCEGMGNFVEATHTCTTCGKVNMCAMCHQETHASEQGSHSYRNHMVVDIHSGVGEASRKNSSAVPDTRARTSSPFIDTIDADDVDTLNRIPFPSEIKSMRDQFIQKRKQRLSESSLYDFYSSSRRNSSATPSRASVVLTSPGMTDAVDGAHVVAADGAPIYQLVHNVTDVVSVLPTRRQAMAVRKEAATEARHHERQRGRTHELLQRRNTDILHVDAPSPAAGDAQPICEEHLQYDSDGADDDLARVHADGTLPARSSLLIKGLTDVMGQCDDDAAGAKTLGFDAGNRRVLAFENPNGETDTTATVSKCVKRLTALGVTPANIVAHQIFDDVIRAAVQQSVGATGAADETVIDTGEWGVFDTVGMSPSQVPTGLNVNDDAAVNAYIDKLNQSRQTDKAHAKQRRQSMVMSRVIESTLKARAAQSKGPVSTSGGSALATVLDSTGTTDSHDSGASGTYQSALDEEEHAEYKQMQERKRRVSHLMTAIGVPTLCPPKRQLREGMARMGALAYDPIEDDPNDADPNDDVVSTNGDDVLTRPDESLPSTPWVGGKDPHHHIDMELPSPIDLDGSINHGRGGALVQPGTVPLSPDDNDAAFQMMSPFSSVLDELSSVLRRKAPATASP